VTYLFRIETAGVNLEDVGKENVGTENVNTQEAAAAK
jgi:hypothetical protein